MKLRMDSDDVRPSALPMRNNQCPPMRNNLRPPTTLNIGARHKRSGSVTTWLVLLIVLGVSIGGGVYAWKLRNDGQSIDLDELITRPIVNAPFTHTVIEQGEIESSSNTEINCQVKSRDGTAILWVIDEGVRVKAGDRLVELDQSDLDIRLKEQKIEVITAQSEVATAKALVEQAMIAKREYLEGIYATEVKTIKSAIAIAEQNLRTAQMAIASSNRLVAKGLAKPLQIEKDKFAVVNAQNEKAAEETKLRVLEELTREKMLVQFNSDIDAAKAKLSAAEAEQLEEENELAEVEEQIENCVIYAPTDGVVVHANRFSSRGGNAEFVVEAGATVRERQTIIRLPDPTQMQVKCKVNESRITLVEEGMPVRIRVDAIPDLELKGRVRKVNRYAEPGSWYSSSIKEYATFIEIIEPPEIIRTGMNAECEIFIEQLDEALQVPVEGLYEHNGTLYSLVQRGSEFQTVPVEMRATNDSMVAINDGLAENDLVVLNLRQHMNLMDLPELEADANLDMKEIAAVSFSKTAGGSTSAAAAVKATPGTQSAPSQSSGKPGGRAGARVGGGPGKGKPGPGKPGKGKLGRPGAGGQADGGKPVTDAGSSTTAVAPS